MSDGDRYLVMADILTSAQVNLIETQLPIAREAPWLAHATRQLLASHKAQTQRIDEIEKESNEFAEEAEKMELRLVKALNNSIALAREAVRLRAALAKAEKVAWLRAACILCTECAAGDVPKKYPALTSQFLVHVWKRGNGHSLCTATEIWEKLIWRTGPQAVEVLPITDALCEDCPPIGYPTNETRCGICPRKSPPDPDAATGCADDQQFSDETVDAIDSLLHSPAKKGSNE